jgi:predicted dehydrogenase
MEKSDVGRRAFLSGAALGAVAANTAWAQDPLKSAKRFRMGFIGTGARGQRDLAAALSRPDVEVVAICDVFKPNLNAAQKMAPNAKVYSDFRDLIAAKDIDAICIATPDHWHAYMTVEACKAGKDVYIEKPSASRSMKVR